MARYKKGGEPKVGDVIKFDIDGETHFGKVETIDGDEADVDQVKHDPHATQHCVVLATAELVHRKRA